MLKILIITLFTFILSACGTNSELIKPGNAVAENLNQTANKKADFDNQPIIIIEESGSMCNLCASYKILVFSDGKVDWESEKFIENNSNQGERFIKKTETFSKQLSKEQFQNLKNEFERIKFFEFEDTYIPKTNCPETLSDSNTIHIFYKNGEKSKTINYYRGCRGNGDLAKLAKLRDSLNKLFAMDTLLNNNIMTNTNINQ